MLDLLLLSLILFGVYGVGAEFLDRYRGPLDPGLKKGVFAIAIGLGVLAYGVLLLGLLGWLREWIGWAWLAIFWGIAARHLIRCWKRLRREAQKAAATPVTWITRVTYPHPLPEHPELRPLRWALGALILMGLGAGLICNLAPATPATAWDDLTYHLAAPKIYLQAGRIHYIPTDHHSNFPFTLEMLYTLGLLLRGQTLARLFHFAYLVLTVLGLYSLGRDYFGKWVGPLAAATFVLTPTVQWEMGTAYNEFGLALYQLLAIYALLEYLNLGSRAQTLAGGQKGPSAAPRAGRWLGIMGVCLGFALGVKATAIAGLGWLLGEMIFFDWRDGRPAGTILRALLQVGLIAGLIGSPWYIKSYVWTRNPVFPFFHSVFKSPLWSADREKGYRASQRDFGRPLRIAQTGNPAHRHWNAHRRLTRFPTVLWRLTMNAPDFYDRAQSFAVGHIGPLYLAFLPVAVGLWLVTTRQRPPGGGENYREEREEEFAPGEKPADGSGALRMPSRTTITEQITIPLPRIVGGLLVYCLLSLLFWFLTMQYTRYLVPLLPLLALLAAYGMEGAVRLTAYTRVLVWPVLLATWAFGVRFGLLLAEPCAPVVFGQMTPDQYLRQRYPAYEAIRFLNTQTPESAKVIFLGEPLGFYCDRPYLYGEAGHSTLIPYQSFRSAVEMIRYYRQSLHATHLLLNQNVIRWRTGRDRFSAFLREGRRHGWLRPVYEERTGPYAVWEITLE